jgi:hypothetical protein
MKGQIMKTNRLNKIAESVSLADAWHPTERELYLLRWVLAECDAGDDMDEEDLRELLQSAISAWNGGAR